MRNKVSQLIDLVQKLPDHCLDDAIGYVEKKIEENSENKPILSCPYCQSKSVTRFGRKQGKQRYRCKCCGKTYVETTNTVMCESHCGEAVWKQVIRDTIDGVPIDKTVESVGLSHPTIFRMRHKILLSLEAEEERMPTMLDGVCELDDTYVLESYKGTKIPEDYWRGARKHGAKAQKRGISNEYLSISTGIERDGEAFTKTVTRATPSKEDIITVFGGHIGKDTLILCDGDANYKALSENNECAVKNVDKNSGKGFYNINTINSYHSFIKSRYNQYRGVASKYLNRYNVLFSKTFRSDSELADEVYKKITSNENNHYHNINDVETLGLLDI